MHEKEKLVVKNRQTFVVNVCFCGILFVVKEVFLWNLQLLYFIRLSKCLL